MMDYETRRKIAEIVLEILTDDDSGIPNLSNTEAIEYGHAIAEKLSDLGLISNILPGKPDQAEGV